MTEPTTPTGRALWDSLRFPDQTLSVDDILAIEAEAREQERERLRALVAKERRDEPWPQFGPLADGRIAAREAFNMAVDIFLEMLTEPHA
jgi:hypothetical protein